MTGKTHSIELEADRWKRIADQRGNHLHVAMTDLNRLKSRFFTTVGLGIVGGFFIGLGIGRAFL